MLCEICNEFEVEWVHQLDPDKTHHRVYGKGHTWSHQICVCDRCDRCHRDGQFEALVALQAGADQLDPEAVEEQIRKPFEVYCAAFVRSVPRDDLLPPGVTALRAEGFIPVSELTGDPDFAQGWPEEHRRLLPETRLPERLRTDSIDDEGFWLIRSPWPNISMIDAFSVIWDYLHPRAPIVNHRIDHDQHRAAIAEFAALDASDVASLIADRRARESDD